jgi:hypothetical protein
VSSPGIICGYQIHPAASVFPLIEGDEFDDLCDSIRSRGVQHPAVVRGTELLDGRNRMRACERLKAEGWAGSCPTVEWKDDGRNVAEWIWDTNAIRRHMDDDGIVMASSVIWPLIAKENEARKSASKFDSEKASKAAKARHAVRTKSTEPQKRDTKSEDARSTVGQVAAKAGTSMHKARQAVTVQKAIQAGVIPEEVRKDVIAGKKKLRDAVKDVPAKPKADRKPRSNGSQGDAKRLSIDDQIRRAAHRAWSTLRGKFVPGNEHKKLRAVLLEIIRKEQEQFDNI